MLTQHVSEISIPFHYDARKTADAQVLMTGRHGRGKGGKLYKIRAFNRTPDTHDTIHKMGLARQQLPSEGRRE